jgi:hypothetical protein
MEEPWTSEARLSLLYSFFTLIAVANRVLGRASSPTVYSKDIEPAIRRMISTTVPDRRTNGLRKKSSISRGLGNSYA